MKLTLGFSPCPNDTFMFDAMVHGKVDMKGVELEVIMDDVEALNQRAFRGELDITKLSYHAYAYVTDRYALLTSGSALGNNCGPLLIARAPGLEIGVDTPIAIPGKFTTANLLLSLSFPQALNKLEMAFSEIENAVLQGDVDAGLIIHENRFTYQEHGLHKIVDLGEFWERSAGCPIPLGGIAVKRDLPRKVQRTVNEVLQASIEFAFENPESSFVYVSAHAQEMDHVVMRQHIELYVNKYSVDLGIEGKRAVQELFTKAKEVGMIDGLVHPEFVDST